MKPVNILRSLTLMATVAALVAGCASYEVNTGRGNIPGHWIRYEMQESDRAVESARQAGKDKVCPVEFKAAEDAKNNAYDVFRSCRTEEGAALAKEATAKANALCPPKSPVVVPPPPAPPLDRDGDGVPDSVDKCPNTPKGVSVDSSGCPVDSDNDGVPDYLDKCPDTPKGTKVDKDGCPEVVAQPKAAPAKLCSPAIIDIQFDTNKSDIKPKSRDELKKLADFLTEFPNAKGTIAGYTDNVGNKASNMKLSQRRADSVRAYLIKNFNIAPERISSKGYGPDKPIADNKTSAGKAQNRRIEANFTCD